MLPTLDRVMRTHAQGHHVDVGRVQSYFRSEDEGYRRMVAVYCLLGVPSDWIAGDAALKYEFGRRVGLSPEEAVRKLFRHRKAKQIPTEEEAKWIRMVIRAEQAKDVLRECGPEFQVRV